MAFNYNPKEFIKVYRKLMKWEWYTDANTKSLFIHCLLRANWKSGTWKGIHYEAGEFITSIRNLAEETGQSTRNVRTALTHLEMTGEVTSRMTDKVTGKRLTKNRIITVNNWDAYQAGDKQNDKQSDKQNGNQTTIKTSVKRQAKRQSSDNSIRIYKNIKNNKEKKEIKELSAQPSGLSEDEATTMFDGRITVAEFKKLTPEEQEEMYERYWV